MKKYGQNGGEPGDQGTLIIPVPVCDRVSVDSDSDLYTITTGVYGTYSMGFLP